MLLLENDTGYKKVCIWKDKIPFNYVKRKNLHLSVDSGDISWYKGLIGIEAKLHASYVSNYAMICMKYTYQPQNKTDIIINFGGESNFFSSHVLPYNKNIHVGLNREFANVIDEFFKEYPHRQLPQGTIEILGGGYDEVGSSNVAFKKVMEILIFLFLNSDRLYDNALQSEIFKLM